MFNRKFIPMLNLILFFCKIYQIQAINDVYARLIENDLVIDAQSLVTLEKNVNARFPSVIVNNTLVGGNVTITNVSIIHYLDLHDSEAYPLYSLILSNVRVEKNVIIGPNNKFKNSILIDNSVINPAQVLFLS